MSTSADAMEKSADLRSKILILAALTTAVPSTSMTRTFILRPLHIHMPLCLLTCRLVMTVEIGAKELV